MTTLLHISDTPRAKVPYFDALIRRVRPDILIHTGDMVDDVKVGRLPVRKEYLAGLSVILAVMERSGARETYICPGNNDLPDEIARRAPWAKVVTPDTLLTLEGVTVCLTHVPGSYTPPARITLYGHGYTAETRRRRDNTPQRLYLNASLTAHVITLPQCTVKYIDQPELYRIREEVWKT